MDTKPNPKKCLKKLDRKEALMLWKFSVHLYFISVETSAKYFSLRLKPNIQLLIDFLRLALFGPVGLAILHLKLFAEPNNMITLKERIWLDIDVKDNCMNKAVVCLSIKSYSIGINFSHQEYLDITDWFSSKEAKLERADFALEQSMFVAAQGETKEISQLSLM